MDDGTYTKGHDPDHHNHHPPQFALNFANFEPGDLDPGELAHAMLGETVRLARCEAQLVAQRREIFAKGAEDDTAGDACFLELIEIARALEKVRERVAEVRVGYLQTIALVE
jgi:hypothetical protein